MTTAAPPTHPNPAATVAVAAPKEAVKLGGAQGDLDQLFRLCKALSMAQLLPNALRGKPSDVLIIVLYGQELNLSPVQSIQGIYVVNGKPQLAGQLWLAKVREHGHRPEIVHAPGSCTVTITRGDTGEVHSETFTQEDAKTAGLAGKDTYKQYNKRMLMWRAVSDCATVICPEVALGFGVAEVASESAAIGRGEAPVLAGIVGTRPGAPVKTDADIAAEADAALAQTPAAADPLVHDAEIVDPPAPAAGPTAQEQAAAYADIEREHQGDTAAPADVVAEPGEDFAGPTDDDRAAVDAFFNSGGEQTALGDDDAQGEAAPKRGRR